MITIVVRSGTSKVRSYHPLGTMNLIAIYPILVEIFLSVGQTDIQNVMD